MKLLTVLLLLAVLFTLSKIARKKHKDIRARRQEILERMKKR